MNVLIFCALALTGDAIRILHNIDTDLDSEASRPAFWWRPGQQPEKGIQLSKIQSSNTAIGGMIKHFMNSQGKSHCQIFFSFSKGSMLDSLPLDPSHGNCGYWVGTWRAEDSPPIAEVNPNPKRTVIATSLPANPEKNQDFQFSIMRWASAHGYTVIFVDGYSSEMKAKLGNRDGYFAKVYLCKELINANEADTVMWMDSDAFIYNGKYGIEDLLSTYGASENSTDVIWQWGEWVNSGSVVLYNTEKGRRIVNKWWDLGLVKHGYPSDQTALHDAVVGSFDFLFNKEKECERFNSNSCMKHLLIKNHISSSQLTGVLSVPAPGGANEAAHAVKGEPLRLQCTGVAPQGPDFKVGCLAAPSIVVHVGSPWFANDFHRAQEVFSNYLDRMQAKEPLTSLWGLQ